MTSCHLCFQPASQPATEEHRKAVCFVHQRLIVTIGSRNGTIIPGRHVARPDHGGVFFTARPDCRCEGSSPDDKLLRFLHRSTHQKCPSNSPQEPADFFPEDEEQQDLSCGNVCTAMICMLKHMQSAMLLYKPCKGMVPIYPVCCSSTERLDERERRILHAATLTHWVE